MNQNNLSFLEYYNTKTPFEKEIIEDLLRDLILVIGKLLPSKKDRSIFDNEKIIEGLTKDLDQEDLAAAIGGVSLLQSDGLIVCKKRNNFHKEVFKDGMIATEEAFGNIASLRRESMRLLDTLGIIILKSDNPIELFMNSEEFKKLYKTDDQGKKKIVMEELKSLNLGVDLNHIPESSSITQESIQKLQESIHQFQDKLEYGYGEDTINQDLNRDKSYHAIMLFHGEKEDLEDLLEYLEQSKGKQIIKDVSFQDGELVINGRLFTMSKSMSRDFLMLLVRFFEKNAHQNSVSVRGLIDFSETLSNLSFDKLQINTLTVGKIQNGYLQTIIENIGENYANPEIFKMKGSIISKVLDTKR